MKHIIITGCSWSGGVWGQDHDQQYGLLDQGVASLFMNRGYKILNLSQPGSDPWGLVQPLDAFLWINPHVDIAKIYYFQTDIGRSFSFKKLPIENFDSDLTKALKSMYRDLYQELDQLAKRRNKKISVVGGLTDVTVSFNDFDNIELEIPSWCQLIDPSLTPIDLIDPIGFEILNAQYPDYKDQIYTHLELANARLDFFNSNKEWFYPDGRHPNMHAHQLLFENLIQHV